MREQIEITILLYMIIGMQISMALFGCAASSKKSTIAEDDARLQEQRNFALKNETITTGGDMVVDSQVAMQAMRQYGWLVGLSMVLPTIGYALTHRWKWTRGMLDIVKGKRRLTTKEKEPP